MSMYDVSLFCLEVKQAQRRAAVETAACKQSKLFSLVETDRYNDMKHTCDIIRWQNGKETLNNDRISVNSQEQLLLIIINNIFQAVTS